MQGPAMPNRSSKQARDQNQPAKPSMDFVTGEQGDMLLTADGKNAAAVALGRRGGLKGGAARAERLTLEERRKIARIAAAARWKRDDG